MNKKNKLPIFIAITIVIVAILAIIFLNQGGSGVEFYSVGNTFQLSFFPNYLMNCEIFDKLEVFVKERNAWVQVSNYRLDDINPYLNQLVIRNTGETITDWQNNIYLTCDYPNSGVKAATVQGSILFAISASDPSGNNNIIKTVKVDFGEKTLKDNSERKIASYQFKSEDIEKFLKANKNNDAWVKVFMDPDFNFKLTFTDGSTQNSKITLYEGTLYTNYLAKILNEQPTTASLGTQTRVETFEPKIFQKPLTSSQRFITITGAADKYESKEGLPTIQLKQPDGTPGSKIPMKIKGINSATQWTEFGISISLPPDPTPGTWSITMESPAAQRGKSIRTFEVLDAKEVNKPTSSGNGGTDPTKISLETSNEKAAILGKAFIKYKVTYQGGVVQNNLDNEEGFEFGLTPLKLTNDLENPKQNDVRLDNIRLETYLKFGEGFDKTFSLLSDKLTYTGIVKVAGKEKQIPSFSITPLSIGTKNDFGILINAVELTESEIQSLLTDVNTLDGQRERVTVILKVDGDFKLRSGTGEQYTGMIKDAIFTYETYFTRTSSTPGSGESGGSPGGTPGQVGEEDCFDFFGVKILCSPKTTCQNGEYNGKCVTQCPSGTKRFDNDIVPKPANEPSFFCSDPDDSLGSGEDKAGVDEGAFGFCKDSIVQCVQALSDQINAQQNFDSQNMIIIIIGILIIAAIFIYALKKPQAIRNRF